MNDKDILQAIKKLIHLTPDWDGLHIKLQSSKGPRELFLSNQTPIPVIQEDNETKLIRIFNFLKRSNTLSSDDEEWWKDLQMKLSQNGSKPQILLTDSYEEALQKAKDAGII